MRISSKQYTNTSHKKCCLQWWYRGWLTHIELKPSEICTIHPQSIRHRATSYSANRSTAFAPLLGMRKGKIGKFICRMAYTTECVCVHRTKGKNRRIFYPKCCIAGIYGTVVVAEKSNKSSFHAVSVRVESVHVCVRISTKRTYLVEEDSKMFQVTWHAAWMDTHASTENCQQLCDSESTMKVLCYVLFPYTYPCNRPYLSLSHSRPTISCARVGWCTV